MNATEPFPIAAPSTTRDLAISELLAIDLKNGLLDTVSSFISPVLASMMLRFLSAPVK
jgi:hypothetical protein